MATRKHPPLKPPVISDAFLEGGVSTRAAAPAEAPPAAHAHGLSLELLEDVVPVQMVSIKIPLPLYNDIERLRRHTRLTMTKIFVESATPEVAKLLADLEAKLGRKP